MSLKGPPEITSDLIDAVHHEHAHMRRLFVDLVSSFESIARGEVDEESREEVVSVASEDLEVALEDMLHHFNQEEEIFFIELEQRFPFVRPRVESLVDAHETMSKRTRWLQEQLARPPEELMRNLEVILDVLHTMARLVDEHTQEEAELFNTVLEAMSPEERRDLLERMREL